MKQLLIAIMALFLSFNSVAQSPPVVDINISAVTACEPDLKIRIHAILNNGTIVATSHWFAASMIGSSVSWNESDIASNVGWDIPSTGPGVWDPMTNDYFFGRFDIKNCNNHSTGMTSPCTSGNFDEMTVHTTHPVDCFEYSTNCNTCSGGQTVDAACGNNWLQINIP